MMKVKRCAGCHGRIKPKGMGACPRCGREVSPADAFLKQPGWWTVPEMRYQNTYLWLVLVSSLDVMLTLVVLVTMDGFEVNPIAAAVIDTHGFAWAIIFKFAIVVLVVLICEVVGRVHDRSGRKLARAAVVINSLPVIYTFVLLLLMTP